MFFEGGEESAGGGELLLIDIFDLMVFLVTKKLIFPKIYKNFVYRLTKSSIKVKNKPYTNYRFIRCETSEKSKLKHCHRKSNFFEKTGLP